ncbi:DNA cytosine methyltransferase [Vibrio fluvialis]|uniref:DNA cytosine methyltransferase n=1 Tax=Vibrio fluvialis TaxID=676 RepID=UPI001EEBAA81|nr:DNA cytosine methyltransferase [Vibrio fluvialis]MCG6373526.1 DNA cytosine methyltransferase [Vibrio fluvialis]
METGDILVIDLFAGPGGLGEGVSSVKTQLGAYPFKIGVSVERESSAHKTLTTRAFYRKIRSNKNALADYNSYLSKSIDRAELMRRHPKLAKEALLETLGKPRALGEDNHIIHNRIRKVIRRHTGPKVVIGGPPCQAYSLAGRSRNAGIENYRAEEDHRNFLYLEYLQVLAIAQPEVFVMENVKGILSAKVNDNPMFPQILKDLREPSAVTNIPCEGYRIYSLVTPAENVHVPEYKNPSDYLIRSEEYGVPQARHRVILLGVRNDINSVPRTLQPHTEEVTVKQVLSDLPMLRSGFSKRKDTAVDWQRIVSKNGEKLHKILPRLFPEAYDSQLVLQPIHNLKRKESVKMPHHGKSLPNHLRDWFLTNPPPCVLNHETRGHMESDLLRYAFSASYTALSGGVSPKSKDFPKELAPSHENWDTGSHADRFRTQAANKCSTTVTSHISKDGHYFIHYDPKQCRSLTVREAARLQTFPDNYIFEGTRTQQYVQVGNAVPPYLAQQIGQVVLELLNGN